MTKITRRTMLSGGTAALAFAYGAPWTSAATPATPVSGGDLGALPAMLTLAPDMLASADPAPARLATYANLAAQLAAVGAVIPSSPQDPSAVMWSQAAANLDFSGAVAQYGLQPEWRAAFGFDLLQVDQALWLGEPPATLTLLRGRFDPSTIQTALAAGGYQPVTAGEAAIFSLRTDPQADLGSAVGRWTLGSMNNVALLPNGMLVTCGAMSDLRTAMDAAIGQSASLAQQPLVAALLAGVPTDLAAAVMISGSVLGGLDPAVVLGANGGPTENMVATQTAELVQMPPVLLAFVGVTPGGPLPALSLDATPEPEPSGDRRARCVVALLVADEAAARQAATVVEARLSAMDSATTGRLYAEDFPERTVTVVPDAPAVVVVELVPGPGRTARLIFDRLDQRDLGFAAW